MATNVGQLSTDELKEIIGTVVEEKLKEILGDLKGLGVWQVVE